MLKKMVMLSVAACALALAFGIAPAADRENPDPPGQSQEQIYGSQLMTQQECDEYRTRVRAAKTAGEREQIRREHHQRMKKLAKECGIALIDDLSARDVGRGDGEGRNR